MCFAFVFLILVQAVLNAVHFSDNLSKERFPKYNSFTLRFLYRKVQEPPTTCLQNYRRADTGKEETQAEAEQEEVTGCRVARTEV